MWTINEIKTIPVILDKLDFRAKKIIENGVEKDIT